MEVLKLDNKQQAFLASQGIVFDYSSMSDDDLVRLEDEVGWLVAQRGFDSKNKPNEVGLQAERILDLIGEIS